MYGTAKCGLVNFVKSLALAGGKHGVRAVCVSPGPVLTRPGMNTMLTALGRAAEPDELVDVILYLCGDSASFITGVNILADGGHLCLPPPYGI
jgi:NAD(P)-dependent dehydrogenase (short-subunit alcohol dehydrogenase family)